MTIAILIGAALGLLLLALAPRRTDPNRDFDQSYRAKLGRRPRPE